jgi:membrane fusion protein, heavy metal efflux system
MRDATKIARRGGFLLLVLLATSLFAACGDPAEPGEEHAEDSHAEGEHAAEEGHEEGVVLLNEAKLEVADIETTAAEERRLAPQIETTGQVGYEEDRLAHVSPRIPGRVVQAPASLGDRVTRGEVLAVLDSVELGQAKADYLAARARESVTGEAYERERTLYEDRISSQREMLEARADHLEAQAERERARETLRLYGVGDREISAMEAGDRGASLLPLRSPIAGTVVEKHATLGELATSEESLFTVADLGHVWIWIDVFEQQLAGVHLGDDVEVRVGAFPARTFAGEITYLAPQVAAETRSVRARIDVDNADGLLRPGMFASIKLIDPHATEAPMSVVVPETAIQLREGEPLVFVPLGSGRFAAREVELGRREGGWVEVVSGLTAGEEVVTEGSFFLKSELAREELGGGHSH